MNNLKKILDIEPQKTTTKSLILYMVLAYILTLTVRLFLYYQISDNSEFFYNGHIIPLWTPDAGLYGFYAEQLLQGVSYPFISEYIPAYILYGIVKLTGVDLNSAIFFAPALLSSLVVIPIILIANHYKLVRFGLYGAIIGSLMTSYYYRTHLGYYDTDILNAFFPLLAIYFLIRLVDSQKIINAIYASGVLILFSLWYHSSASIILSIVAIFLLYTVIYYRKSSYSYQSLFILSIALAPILFIYKLLLLLLVSVLFYTINRYKPIDYKAYLLVLTIGIVTFLSIGNTAKYYERANSYINKSSSIVVNTSKGEVKFKSDLGSVMEAKGINLSQVTHRVSGATPFFILALLGYVALLIKYRSMLLTLPLAIITFLSMVAGLRFTLYGVTIFSFTMVFGIYLVFKNILVTWGEFPQKISNIASQIFLTLVALFAIYNIINYNKHKISPTFFSSTQDIQTLDKFKNQFKKDDFLLTWWDYGWTLWYYLNIDNTLVDNGKHQQDTFIISKILLSSNQTFVKNASIFFTEKYREGQQKGFSKVMDYFLQNHSIEYLKELENSDFKLPKLDRNIYILLHKEMLKTLASIETFSNLDLKTGQNYKSNFIDMGVLTKKYDKSQKSLKTDKMVTIDTTKGEIKGETKSRKIGKIAVIEENQIKFEKSYISSDNSTILIHNGKVLLLTPKLYNSFLIQALLFNNYDHKYFTKVAKSNNFIILKVNH